MISNVEMRDTALKVFSYGSFEVPFFERDASTDELLRKHGALKPGGVLYLSMPFGSGKTFFIEHLISLGKLQGYAANSAIPRAEQIAESSELLDAQVSRTSIVDDCDARISWSTLKDAMKTLRAHLEKTGKNAIVIGDYTLRNKEFSEDMFRTTTFLDSFEPLTQERLEGVLTQRLQEFLKGKDESDYAAETLFEERLLNTLAPKWMINGNTFRRVFPFLLELCKQIPYSDDKCFFDYSFAQRHATENSNYYFSTDKQTSYYDVLKRYLKERYPDGKGIQEGLSAETLFQVATQGDFEDIDEFYETVLEPFARMNVLISIGNPYYTTRFHRHPEPYVPSAELLLQL
jgi:hypothetical protein